MHRMLSALHAISDNGNELLSKFIVYAGVSGSTVGIANNMIVSSATSDNYAFWGMVAGVAGGLSLVIKSLSGAYFDYQKSRRDKILFDQNQEERQKEYRRKHDKEEIKGDK